MNETLLRLWTFEPESGQVDQQCLLFSDGCWLTQYISLKIASNGTHWGCLNSGHPVTIFIQHSTESPVSSLLLPGSCVVHFPSSSNITVQEHPTMEVTPKGSLLQSCWLTGVTTNPLLILKVISELSYCRLMAHDDSCHCRFLFLLKVWLCTRLWPALSSCSGYYTMSLSEGIWQVEPKSYWSVVQLKGWFRRQHTNYRL